MAKCDTCKIEMSIRKSCEPACCAWYLENAFINGEAVDRCPVYDPVDTLPKVKSKLCPSLTGHILRWIDSSQFVASVTNRYGIRGEMICHKDNWCFI